MHRHVSAGSVPPEQPCADAPDTRPNEVRVVYDGACPLCRFCVSRLRPRSEDVRFTLIDARIHHAERCEFAASGFDLNDGMAIQAKGERHSGPAAAHALALMQRCSGLGERMIVWCFSSPRRAELLYPLFKACRRFLLFVLNRRPL
jgi:predicted DCC family thiol-disulfide oxidoreductase YuxK